jgi:cytochrome c peroxidase
LFDHWYYDKQPEAISKQAQRGFSLFAGKAQCINCHIINAEYALFTDNALHNTGIGWQASMTDFEKESVLIAPGVRIEVSRAIKEKVGNKPQSDLGYYEVTQNPSDRWRYRTPGLRNVALTAPYMHDGSLASLREVIEFYNQGGFKNETQSPLMEKLNLSAAEIDDIEAFLLTLTGDNVAELISDAFSVPVGDLMY